MNERTTGAARHAYKVSIGKQVIEAPQARGDGGAAAADGVESGEGCPLSSRLGSRERRKLL